MKNVDELLENTGRDRVQRVGEMQVIPILGDSSVLFDSVDGLVAADGRNVVHVQNRSAKPVIIPPGFRFDGTAQHTKGVSIVSGHSTKDVGSLVASTNTHAHMMPANIRGAMATGATQRQVWDFISRFNYDFGIQSKEARLQYFEDRYKEELTNFVSEFELVPSQIGAVILIGGVVSGIEMAPTTDAWSSIWKPLVRDSYGPLAIKFSRRLVPSKPRLRLNVKEPSLKALMNALIDVREKEELEADQVIDSLLDQEVDVGEGQTDSFVSTKRVRATNLNLAGQIMTVEGGRSGKKVTYASLTRG